MNAKDKALTILAQTPTHTIHLTPTGVKMTMHKAEDKVGKYLEDENEELDESEVEEQAEAEAVAGPALTVPSILHYDSKTHGVTRYYKATGTAYNPEFTDVEDEALIFESIDHLTMAGQKMRRAGYRGLKITPKMTPAQYVESVP